MRRSNKKSMIQHPQNIWKYIGYYIKAILEIEELWTTNKSLKSDPVKRKELQTLETSCRLNYCNVKAKQGDFDIVRIQVAIYLQIIRLCKYYKKRKMVKHTFVWVKPTVILTTQIWLWKHWRKLRNYFHKIKQVQYNKHYSLSTFQ